MRSSAVKSLLYSAIFKCNQSAKLPAYVCINLLILCRITGPPDILWGMNYILETWRSVNILGKRPSVPGKGVKLQVHLFVSFICRDLRESGQGLGLFVFGISAWISMYLIYSRYSVQLDTSLVSIGHETETMEFSFAWGPDISLELCLLLFEIVVRWIYFREQWLKWPKGRKAVIMSSGWRIILCFIKNED